MAPATNSSPKRTRITIAVDPAFHRRLSLAAAERDLSVRQYVLQAIEERLRHDVDGAEEPPALTAKTDPVLAELWDNPQDAEYDRL